MGTVLVVEEDGARLIALAMILRACGYDVLESSNQDEAVHHCLDHYGQIHALVIDFEMGGNHAGPRIAERLLALLPAMQVIFLLSSPPVNVLDAGWLPSGCTFLRKPFEPEALVNTVQRLQDRLWHETSGRGVKAVANS